MISCISPNSGSCEHTLNTLRYADRVKSLSKGSSKKDVPSVSSNMRESSPGPPPSSNLDYTNDAAGNPQRFAWSNKIEQDASLYSNMVRVPSGREEPSRISMRGNGYDLSEEGYEQEKASCRNKGIATNVHSAASMDGMRNTGSQMQWKNIPEVHVNGMDADDDLNALLKEEEDLVMAHREQVEETINILREEMKLLEEADQPGNQLDEYITRLSTILSKKATALMKLQARLAHFQHQLTEQNVLVTPLGL